MQIGDLLVASGIVTAHDIADAQRRRSTDRGSLPETLIALGAVDPDVLLRFLERVPPAPTRRIHKVTANTAVTAVSDTPNSTLMGSMTSRKIVKS